MDQNMKRSIILEHYQNPKNKGSPEAKTTTSSWYCSKTAFKGTVMSIHCALAGKNGATISW